MNASIFIAVLVVAQPAAERDHLLQTFRDEFISITPGRGRFPKTVRMGQDAGPANQRPAHVVTFSHDFQIAKYEVPQNLWQVVMGVNPSRWKGPRNSVEMLSFEEAEQFCTKVTAMMRAAKLIRPNEVVRLPTEAEWEYAARAGTNTTYSFGEDASQLDDHAWHTGNAAGNDPPVGAKKPNPWGLYDVHGYLWEWCADAAHATYQGAPIDGSAWQKPADSQQRILRGGSWKDRAEKLTSSYRRLASKTLRDDAVGLRCVLATSP